MAMIEKLLIKWRLESKSFLLGAFCCFLVLSGLFVLNRFNFADIGSTKAVPLQTQILCQEKAEKRFEKIRYMDTFFESKFDMKYSTVKNRCLLVMTQISKGLCNDSLHPPCETIHSLHDAVSGESLGEYSLQYSTASDRKNDLQMYCDVSGTKCKSLEEWQKMVADY